MTARGNSRLRIPITVVRANFGVIRSKSKQVGLQLFELFGAADFYFGRILTKNNTE